MYLGIGLHVAADSLLFDSRIHTIKLVSNKINRLIWFVLGLHLPFTKILDFFEGLRGLGK